MNDPWIRNLPIPYLSQRENRYKFISCDLDFDGEIKTYVAHAADRTPVAEVGMADMTCNITCLTMVLHYLGIYPDSCPDDLLEKLFNKSEPFDNDSLINMIKVAMGFKDNKDLNFWDFQDMLLYSTVLQKIAEALGAIKTKVEYDFTLENVKNEIANGYPVIVSCGITHKKTEIVNKKLNDYKEEPEYIAKLENANTEVSTIENNLQQAETDNKSEIEITEIEAFLTNAKANLEIVQQEPQIAVDNWVTQVELIEANGGDAVKWHRGHYIVIRGFTENCVIINDPWGNPLDSAGQIPGDLNNSQGSYYDDNGPIGDNIHIPNSDFQKQFGSRFHSALVIYNNRWSHIFPQYNTRGLAPRDVDIDEWCKSLLSFKTGGYPMKRSNLWHNGIHIKKESDAVKSIGPGQLIAARARDISTSAADPAPQNGNRCFVLMKHQVNVENVIKEFYVLYMHLKPIDNLETILNGNPELSKAPYPCAKSEINWVNDLMFRTRDYSRVLWDFTAEIKRAADDVSLGFIKRAEIVEYISIEKDRYYFYINDDLCYSPTVKFGVYNIPQSQRAKYREKAEALNRGEIVYFTDLPDDTFEIGGETIIGKFGSFGGYDLKKSENILHMEIFTNDNIIPDKYMSPAKVNGFTLISNDGSPTAMCNRKEMIEFFDSKSAYLNIVDRFKNLVNDGVISKQEMINYNNSPASNHLRKMIVQHTSEWWSEINWEQEMTDAIGVPNRNLFGGTFISKTTGEELADSLNNYVKYIYDPYKWFNKEKLDDLKLSSDQRNLIDQGICTFYHPFEFLKWLIENDNEILG